MRNKLVKHCKKCKKLFDINQTYLLPVDIKYYVKNRRINSKGRFQFEKRPLCPYCSILKEYKKPLRPHDWRVSIAASTEYYDRVR